MAQPSNRDQLVKGAMRCLREKGYARTTARDIARASGANLASIGYHFGSKEALLNEAILASFDEWTERIGEAGVAAAGGDPIEQVFASWRQMLADFAAVRPVFVAFLEALAQAERSPELRVQLADGYERNRVAIAGMVTAALGDRISESDARAVGSFLLAIADGLLIQSFLDPARTPGGDELVGGLGRGFQAAEALS